MLFSAICRMSWNASIVIVLVLAVRLTLKWAPKVYSYALWAVVLFRLLCPVSVTAGFSVLRAADVPNPVPVVREQAAYTAVHQIPQAPVQKNVSIPDALEKNVPVLPFLWLTGAGVMVLYSAYSLWKLRRRLVCAVCLEGNVWLADEICSPFVMGLLRPKIYLPSSLPERERSYILLHERHHIRRLDHITKLLAFGALCLHWFNPLVWLAFFLAGKDMEMSCDEAVMKQLGPEIRADYSASLLRLATGQKIISGAPLAFGEGNTVSRIKNVLRWRQPKRWAAVLAAVLCLTAAAACAADPKEKAEEIDLYMYNKTQEESDRNRTELFVKVANSLAKKPPLSLQLYADGVNLGQYEDCWAAGNAEYLINRTLSVWIYSDIPEGTAADDRIILTQENNWSLTAYSSNYVKVEDGEQVSTFKAEGIYGNLRELFDELEYLALDGFDQNGSIFIPDRGQSYMDAAAEYCQTYENIHLSASPGSKYRYTFVHASVEGRPELTQQLQDSLGSNVYCFHAEAVFIPENARARNQAMEINTTEVYPGTPTDFALQKEALEYSYFGYVALEDGGWRGKIIGTVW